MLWFINGFATWLPGLKQKLLYLNERGSPNSFGLTYKTGFLLTSFIKKIDLDSLYGTICETTLGLITYKSSV